MNPLSSWLSCTTTVERWGLISSLNDHEWILHADVQKIVFLAFSFLNSYASRVISTERWGRNGHVWYNYLPENLRFTKGEKSTTIPRTKMENIESTSYKWKDLSWVSSSRSEVTQNTPNIDNLGKHENLQCIANSWVSAHPTFSSPLLFIRITASKYHSRARPTHTMILLPAWTALLLEIWWVKSSVWCLDIVTKCGSIKLIGTRDIDGSA